MKILKKDRKKILILILIFLIILCILTKISISKNKFYQEDLIFFELFGIQNKIKEDTDFSNNIYKITVMKGEKNYKRINLSQTVDIKTLVNEKIAPGTKGEFYLYLMSNENIDYNIEIIDKNIKPENFKFMIEDNNGIIEKDEVKKVKVKWEWIYETNEKQNIQDTKDGESIDVYNFEIITTGS